MSGHRRGLRRLTSLAWLAAPLLAAVVDVAALAAQADPPHTGPLPPGAVATLRFAAVRDEIGFQIPVPLSAVAGKLPAGHRTVPYSALRASAAAVDAAITADPSLGEMALGVIAWASLDTAAVDGRPSAGRPALLAFVWIPLQREGGARDARIPASASPMLELGFWSSPADFAGMLGDRRPPTLAAEIDWTRRGEKHFMRLRTPDGTTVHAECVPTGVASSDQRGVPFYQVVHAPAPSTTFTILTGGGHRIRSCAPSVVNVEGHAAWSAGVRRVPRGCVPGVHEDSWTARGAVYRGSP